MRNYTLFLTMILITVSGCVTTRRSTARSSSYNLNTVNTTLTQHDSQIAKLTFTANQLKESNAACVESINTMNKQIALLNRKILTLEQKNRKLTEQLAAERKARIADSERLVKVVAEQTAAAINSIKKQQAARPVTRRPSGGRPAMSGEFYEYTVEPGATLSVIARAYHVSVADIKRANKLKSDNIRIGQKLYIPKK